MLPPMTGAGSAFPRAGTVLADTYEIGDLVGTGGYGVVVDAVDRVLQRRVAVKFLRRSLATRASARERFIEEARAMARHQHTNVCAIYRVDTWRDTPYIVMEYVEGRTLFDYLDEKEFRVSVDDALGLLQQICRGVDAIHSAGVVHYDLKPENLMISAASRVVITDFGLSALAGEDEHRHAGTVGYVAPEVLRRDPIPPGLRSRADIYGIGVLSYILFVGGSPFPGPDTDEIAAQQLERDVRPPTEYRSKLPKALDDVVMAALSPEPRDRHASGQEFFEDVERALRTWRRFTPVPRRVAVVDDDAVIRQVLSHALVDALPMCDVTVYEAAEPALRELAEEPPDLLITDLGLPGMDGFQLVEKLRANATWEETPIIAITGGEFEAVDWARLTAAGADGFLTKPIERATLSAVVRRLVSRR
jgi:serine/threonine-protein kinase